MRGILLSLMVVDELVLTLLEGVWGLRLWGFFSIG